MSGEDRRVQSLSISSLVKLPLLRVVETNDENIGFNGYIINLILGIYWEILMNIWTQILMMCKLIKPHGNIGKNLKKW